MKSISTALSNHLDSEVTTLATCWRIVRRDGTEFYFTDHDQNLTVEGNVYEAGTSYDRTAVTGRSDLSVDNLDVSGMLDSDKLDETELRNGLFDRADVYIFLVNWQAPSDGILKLKRGWFGEITINDNGVFSTEIRGLAQAISHNFIEVYAAECRADFCDPRCKLLITDFEVATTVDSASGRSTIVLPEGFVEPALGLSPGTVEFVDGDNIGVVMEIIGYDDTTRTVEFFENVPYPITAGTNIKVAPGCDGSLAACIARDNVINRRAEDYIPGMDELMQYPDAAD